MQETRKGCRLHAQKSSKWLWSVDLPVSWKIQHIETDSKVIVLCGVHFLAVEARSGHKLWEYTAKITPDQPRPSGNVNMATVMQEGKLYILSPMGLQVVKVQSGEEVWHLPLKGQGRRKAYEYVVPLFYKDRVYFSFDDSESTDENYSDSVYLYCVNRNNGQIVWRKKNGVWRYYGDPPTYREIPSACLYSERLLALRYEASPPGRDEPMFPDLVCRDAETGVEIWKRKLPGVEDSKPTCVAGKALVGELWGENEYLVFDAKSGKQEGKIAKGIGPLLVSGDRVLRVPIEENSVRNGVCLWDVRTKRRVGRALIPLEGRNIEQDLTSSGGQIIFVQTILTKKDPYIAFYRVVSQ